MSVYYLAALCKGECAFDTQNLQAYCMQYTSKSKTIQSLYSLVTKMVALYSTIPLFTVEMRQIYSLWWMLSVTGSKVN